MNLAPLKNLLQFTLIRLAPTFGAFVCTTSGHFGAVAAFLMGFPDFGRYNLK